MLLQCWKVKKKETLKEALSKSGALWDRETKAVIQGSKSFSFLLCQEFVWQHKRTEMKANMSVI